MSEQNCEMEEINNELRKLREREGQILELLQAVSTKMNTQTTVVSQITTATVESSVTTVNPTSGMPFNCINAADNSTQQVTPTVTPATVQAQTHPVLQNLHPGNIEVSERKKLMENVLTMHKKLEDMEGVDVCRIDTKDLCLVSGLVIPPKFKLPSFDLYSGATCPRTHLAMYYRRMAAYVDNDKLMIHCFLDSLKGAASKWYLTLDQSKIQCFQDMCDTFMKHYKYNMDLAPDRRELLKMSQNDTESFREYAQRWRDLASQVEPPLSEKELTDWFVDTVRPDFYERMIGNVSASFSDIVAVGIKVERGLKNGKLTKKTDNSNNNVKKSFKREGDISVVMTNKKRKSLFWKQRQQQQCYSAQQPHVTVSTPTFNNQAPSYQPVPQTTVYQQAPDAPAYTQQAQIPHQNFLNKRKGGRPRIPPISMSYTTLYPVLVQEGLITTRSPGPPRDPPPPSYNPNAYCVFHEGAPGHDLEGCFALKHIVKDLRERGILSFDGSQPIIRNNQ